MMFKKITLRKFIKAVLEAFTEYQARESAYYSFQIDPVKKLIDEQVAYEMTPQKARIYDPRFE